MRLTSFLVKSGYPSSVEDVRVFRIRRYVGILVGSYSHELPKTDLAAITSAGYSYGTTFLLPAIHPIRKLLVCAHVIQLACGLIVPGAPGASCIDCHYSSLVGHKKHDIRIVWVDPNTVIVISTGCAFERHPGLSSVLRSIRSNITDI